MMCKNLVPAAIALAVLVSTSADAQLVKFKFTGEVDDVGAGLSSEFTVGDTLSGTYTTDLSTLDSNGSPTEGSYDNPFTQLDVTFSSGYAVSLNTSSGLKDTMIVNDDPLDIYSVLASVNGPAVSTNTPARFTINLLAGSGPSSFITSDALPAIAPDLSLADFRDGTLSFGSNFDPRVSFQVTSLTTIPEPSTLLLVGMGAIGLAWMRRR